MTRSIAPLFTAQHGGQARVVTLLYAEWAKLKVRVWCHSRPGEAQADFERRYEAAFGAPPALLYLVDGNVFYAPRDE